jgi:membrane protease YdiL (CAAX protease family)
MATALNPNGFFSKACYFEASLILLAIALGWIAGINPFESLHFSELAIGYGVIGTAPLFLLFLVMQHIDSEPVIKIRQLLLDTLGPCLSRYHWTDLFMLAAIAGISEEILFRGVIQTWLESIWSMKTALLASSLMFGLAHAITPLYAILATLVGIYLGLSFDYGGERNILIPIVIHGLYDFLAFIALMRAYCCQQFR